MWTQNLLGRHQGEGERGTWHRRAGRTRTDPRGSCFKSKTPERNHGLTTEVSSINQTDDLQFLLSTPALNPSSRLPRPPPPSALQVHSLAEMDNHLPAWTWAAVPPTSGTGQDLSLGTVVMKVNALLLQPPATVGWTLQVRGRPEGRRPLRDLEPTVKISTAG